MSIDAADMLGERFVPQVKVATRKAFTAFGGNFSNAAEQIGVSPARAHAYADGHKPQDTLPLHRAILADILAGFPYLLNVMAAAEGYIVLPRHIGEGDFADTMSQFTLDAAGVTETAIRILRDGVIDRHEAVEIAPKIIRTIQILHAAQHILNAQHPGAVPHVLGSGE
ncbi:MAG: hypothetical protein GX413_11180 [Acetobacter sp.]|nr:hypothetical protein [Acetobacter sp.]